ncbi:hypothetical protein C8Q79DRAFT_1042848 [Trametes meyenii]|nr:hypothetical protein C8Q79DRAFT_1042848 [Trametes meyenii]
MPCISVLMAELGQGYTAGLMIGVKDKPMQPFSLLVLILHLALSEPGQIRVELDCYSWNEKRRSEVEVDHQFGVTWALNRKLLEDDPDGLLAMGTKTPFNIPMVLLALCFLKGLQHKLPKMHPKFLSGESWVAYNEWPCPDIPDFSNPIPVDTSFSDSWALPLNKLTFYDFAGKRKGFPERHEIVVRREVQSTTTSTSGHQTSDVPYKSLPVVLDTGGRLVYRESRDGFWTTSVGIFSKKTRPATSLEDTYRIPADFPRSKAYVRYEFEGLNGQPVVVYGSLRPVLVACNPRLAGDIRERLIGFFQTMLVSLHQASGSRQDFVRLAGQDREGKKYMLPHPWDVPE